LQAPIGVPILLLLLLLRAVLAIIASAVCETIGVITACSPPSKKILLQADLLLPPAGGACSRVMGLGHGDYLGHGRGNGGAGLTVGVEQA
jgi:hypothetical protein